MAFSVCRSEPRPTEQTCSAYWITSNEFSVKLKSNIIISILPWYNRRTNCTHLRGNSVTKFFHLHGQKFRTSQRRTREVTWQYGRYTLKGNVWQKWNKIRYSTFWLTGNKCRDPAEFLKVSSAILISWFSSTNVTGRAFHRCLFSKFGPYNALQNRGLKSHFGIPSRFWSSVADNIIEISQVPRSLEEKHRMMYYFTNFHLRCWFLRSAFGFKKSWQNDGKQAREQPR